MSATFRDMEKGRYGFRVQSQEDLVSCFRPKDQKKVLFDKWEPFPIDADYYHTWSESSGVYTYLVFKKPEWSKPKGMIFRKTGGGHQQAKSRMCDWCNAVGTSDQIGLMTIAIDSKHTVGMMLCLDLSCREKLETIAALARRDFDSLVNRLCQRIGKFFEQTVTKADST